MTTAQREELERLRDEAKAWTETADNCPVKWEDTGGPDCVRAFVRNLVDELDAVICDSTHE